MWSLITVTHNSAEALRRHWTSQPLPANVEWIVVDNGSSDDSIDMARALGATEVVSGHGNAGFAKANNVGVQVASGDKLAFVNPDVSVKHQDWPLLETALQANHLVAPQLMNDDGSLQPNGRGFPLLMDQMRNRLTSGHALKGTYLNFADPGETLPVVWLTGAVVACARTTFEELGGWSEDYFLYYEDVDLCLRAGRLGMRVAVVGDARWMHGWARDSASMNPAALRTMASSAAKFYRRFPRLLLPKRGVDLG